MGRRGRATPPSPRERLFHRDEARRLGRALAPGEEERVGGGATLGFDSGEPAHVRDEVVGQPSDEVKAFLSDPQAQKKLEHTLKLATGEPLVKGLRFTGFSDEEEAAMELDRVVPFLIEATLKAQGGRYERAARWQNPASSKGTAAETLKALGAR